MESTQSVRYVVAPRVSVMGPDPDRTHYLAGQVYPHAGVSSVALKSLVDNGYLIETAASGTPTASEVVTAPKVGVTITPAPEPLGPPVGPTTNFAEGLPKKGSPDAPPAPLPLREQRVGKWTRDPALLVGKPLDELLCLVLDIDDSIVDADLPATPDAAIRLLSSEFVPV